MSLDDLIGAVVVGTFFFIMVLERIIPARQYPTRALWRVRGVAFLLVMAAVATAAPTLLPSEWVASHRLLDLSWLDPVAGTVVGYLVVSFVSYAWHRATHKFDILWRGFHQLHHSAPRLDIAGGPLFHPLDITMYVLLSTVTTSLVLGLSPEAAGLTGLVAQLYSFFQHANVKTPRWLGYLIQRPESHFVHHSRDVHAFNYSDLPIWDMVFGTFRNPAEFGSGEVGFEAPSDGRYLAMLAFQDVSSGVGTRPIATPEPTTVRFQEA